jgi:hypothetical protein
VSNSPPVLWGAYYNFLRPHKLHRFQTPVRNDIIDHIASPKPIPNAAAILVRFFISQLLQFWLMPLKSAAIIFSFYWHMLCTDPGQRVHLLYINHHPRKRFQKLIW